MFVIGTAGHVDHGKSTLIQALTGIDPDRLREEKERGMTIDLGFAWLRLPSGREVSIVDVPGHERFIKNMLAGVGGIDVALLVVAADEGVMPQTEEHLAILDLLQVNRGVVALTKSDLADDDWLALVEEDVRSRLAQTMLADASIIPVSALTGAGLKQLVSTLDELLDSATPRPDIGRPRLSIDRAFTVAGFGTVVTGTLIDGRLVVGQEVDVVPAGRSGRPLRSRVRGLQTHKKKEEAALPGTRVAINLAALAVEDVQRGDVVTVPGWLEPTTLADVSLRLLGTVPPLERNAVVTVHTGAAEVEAHVSLLQGNALAPGEKAWAQLRLARPLPVVRGDFFVIRSPNTTLGGGKIVDPGARRHRRFQAQVLARLQTMAKGTPEELVLQTLAAQPPQEVAALVQQAGMPLAQTLAVLPPMVSRGQVIILGDIREKLTGRTLCVSVAGWQALSDRAKEALSGYHQQFPLRRGMPPEELKSRLSISARAFAASLPRLAAEHTIMDDSGLLRLPDHEVRFSAAQQVRIDSFFASLKLAPYTPPAREAMEAELGADVVLALVDRGRLVKVREDLLFEAGAYQAMVAGVVDRIKSSGHTNVADVRDLFDTSRKYAIALLEHLDAEHVTRREGDERVLWA